MPTPAELALQKKYAALRAKKEKVGNPIRRAGGVTALVVSYLSVPARQQEQRQPHLQKHQMNTLNVRLRNLVNVKPEAFQSLLS